MATSPAASSVATRPLVLRNPLIVGVIAGVVGAVASLVLPADLPFQPSSLIVFPMLAVAGPIGGAIGGAIGGVSSPLFFVAVPISLVGGALVGWAYRRFVWPQASLAGRLGAWALLVFVVDALSALMFGSLLSLLDPSMPGFPDAFGVVLGYAGVSTVIDVVATTVVMAVLPEGMRQPLTS